MRINEYKCLEDFINEYNGKREIGDEFSQGLEFEYKGKQYRICRESFEPLLFCVYTMGPDMEIVHLFENSTYEAPVQREIYSCNSMEELLECTVIDNRPFKEVIMDDNTLMLSKD